MALVVKFGHPWMLDDDPKQTEAERKRSAELLRKMDEASRQLLVEAARLRRATELYVQREKGTNSHDA